ncbi:MAG: polymer-forming cytoskeletal protein [Ignavibacteriaceae bacterium]|nr:polymer-forming cytoskeletal protein [Ignavibacteriaceae bacterium]
MKNKRKKIYLPISVISSDVILRGELEGKCDMRFDGQITGDISVEGLLLIGKTGRVTGNLLAKNISIAGKVTGNAYAAEKVEITSTGELHGDTKSKSLVIEDGGVYRGTVEEPAEEPSVPIFEELAENSSTALVEEVPDKTLVSEEQTEAAQAEDTQLLEQTESSQAEETQPLEQTEVAQAEDTQPSEDMSKPGDDLLFGGREDAEERG